MIGRIRSAMTYANVASSIALFLVLAGGGAYAASKIKLKNNSVTSAKIKDGAVSTADLAPKAVTPAKLAPNPANFPAANVKKISGTISCLAPNASQCSNTQIFTLGGLEIHLAGDNQINPLQATCTAYVNGPSGRINFFTVARNEIDPSIVSNDDQPFPGALPFTGDSPGAVPNNYRSTSTLIYSGGPSGTVTATVGLHGVYTTDGGVKTLKCDVTGSAYLAK